MTIPVILINAVGIKLPPQYPVGALRREDAKGKQVFELKYM
jgi:hypothetical protein